MVQKQIPDVGMVQKTLFLPLWGRAVETLKKHPRLRDESAARIIE
jgi:O-methyltransferase involved in polyketide biosynthesis